MKNKIPVAVLAATGSVGQRFISLLENHPWFEVVEITASDRSVGKTYQEACHWLITDPMPESVKNLTLLPTEANSLQKSVIAFSALPADIAKNVEPDFARKGIYVCSNASAYRKDPLVPILVPEVNANHLDILDIQQKTYGWSGGIITNPNCTTCAFVVPLNAIDKAYGVQKAIVFSMQAISGAGYPGVASMDIIDNVIPYIGGEEEKVEYEPTKIMGSYQDGKISLHPMVISAHTNRVAVVDAHTIFLSFSTNQKVSKDNIISVLKNYQMPEICIGLPSCPDRGIVYHEADNRPQPRLDRNLGRGMSTSVGRIREDAIFDFRMVSLSHNTIMGAAGGSIFNGELLARRKFGF
jgi:aspartate-semialdehyde dehydrogenase